MAVNTNFFNLMLDIESAIQAIDEKVVNHKNTRRDLLNHFLFPLHYCKIQHLFFFHEEEDAYVPKGTVDFHGRFSEEDEMIHVYIVHNPDDKTYEWHPIIWAYIRSIYIDTIGHELVHRSQYEKRKVVGIADYQRLPNNKEFKCIENDDEAENGLYLILPDEKGRVVIVALGVLDEEQGRAHRISFWVESLRIPHVQRIEKGLQVIVGMPFLSVVDIEDVLDTIGFHLGELARLVINHADALSLLVRDPVQSIDESSHADCPCAFTGVIGQIAVCFLFKTEDGERL